MTENIAESPKPLFKATNLEINGVERESSGAVTETKTVAKLFVEVRAKKEAFGGASDYVDVVFGSMGPFPRGKRWLSKGDDEIFSGKSHEFADLPEAYEWMAADAIAGELDELGIYDLEYVEVTRVVTTKVTRRVIGEAEITAELEKVKE